MYSLGLNPIKTSLNMYIKNELFRPTDPVFTGYSRERLPIGFVRDYNNKDRDMKKIYCLNISEAFRILLLAKTRSGKTFTIRSMCNRMKKCGMAICVLTDVKNEMDTDNRPVQSKFQHKLIKGEKPEAMPIQMFRPTFFQFLEGNASKLPEGQQWGSLDLSRLQPRDFTTLMDFLGLTARQIDGMERALYESKREGIKIRVWDDFKNLIENAEYIESASSILNKLYKINYYNPFDPNHIVRPSTYLRDGVTTGLNLLYYDSLEKNNGFMQVTVANWLREITDARKIKKIPPVVFVVDEMARICPAVGDTVSRYEIMESVDVSTAFDANFIFASQDIVSIPMRVVKQCRYILLPWSIDHRVAIDAMKVGGLESAEVKSQQFNTIRRLMSRMQQRDWIVIDTNMKSMEFITPLAPLTHVKETGE